MYSSVLIRNTGTPRIGAVPVTVTAPAGTRFTSATLDMYRSDAAGETKHTGTLSPDGRRLTLTAVPVDLAPDPAQWIVLVAELQIDPTAAPGDVSIAFTLGAPAFATGPTRITVLGARASVVERAPFHEAYAGAPWALYPSVLIRNTGTPRIGAEPVIATAPVGTRFTSPTLTMYRSDAAGETKHTGTLSPDGRQLTLTAVPVDLAPDPAQWIVLVAELQIDPTAAPGEAPVAFVIGTHAFASGATRIKVLPRP
ncbi:hypothetical protein [Streptomyces jumonjinensis]|uniref:hypothetical protein n=1 Tax=Streptomyces jumonjinensis TaxID=1945 RepID=UPI00379AD44D